ncbi:hypothetical protein Vretifemale_12792 [Volvox reticuliferus]|nr:hypothetical protein Vretifemale_12792 [Volvox reticuliferus]
MDDHLKVPGSIPVCDPYPPQPQSHQPAVAPYFYRQGLYGKLNSVCGGGGGGASSHHGLSFEGCRTDLIRSRRSSAGGGDTATADALAVTAARCIAGSAGEADAAAASREVPDGGPLQALAHGSPAPPARIDPWAARLPSSGGSATAAAAAAGDMRPNQPSQDPPFTSFRTAPVPIPIPVSVGAYQSALDVPMWQQAAAIAYPPAAWTSCRRSQYGLANVDAAAAAAAAAAAPVTLMRSGSLPTPPSYAYRTSYDFRYGYGYGCSYGSMYECGSLAPDGVVPRATAITDAGVTAAAGCPGSAVRDGDGDGGVAAKNSDAVAAAAANANTPGHGNGPPVDTACKSVHMTHQSMSLRHMGYSHWPWLCHPKMPYMYENRLPYNYTHASPRAQPWPE